MSVQEKFEKQFAEEEQEIIVLLKERCGGAGVYEKNWLRPSVTFSASVDGKSGEFSKTEGSLEWLIKNTKQRKNWGYDFEQYGIYRVLVRKCVPVPLKEYQSEKYNNRYMVVKVLEENVQNDELQSLKEYYLKPVTIENELGLFTLDREFSWFEGEMDWNGEELSVFLETDEANGETAEKAMSVLLKCAGDRQGFDKKNREFAAQELLELANDWLADDDSEDKPDEITKEMFVERMEMSEMTVNSDGSITLYYNDGDMFWGHSIEIDINPDGTYNYADIAG